MKHNNHVLESSKLKQRSCFEFWVYLCPDEKTTNWRALEVVAVVYGCLGLGSFDWVGVCWVDGGC